MLVYGSVRNVVKLLQVVRGYRGMSLITDEYINVISGDYEQQLERNVHQTNSILIFI